jgi:Lar family restriction alleviation protein
MSDILPCPFCGIGPDIYTAFKDESGKCPVAFMLRCDECGTDMEAYKLSDVIEKWNRRTPPKEDTHE